MSIICLRPDLDQGRNALALYISGALPNAKPGDAYEAELQIHNQVGVCTILSITGGPVPPGGGWFIRGDKLVLSWPAYSADAAPINNANFELGDLTDWTVTKRGELPGYPTYATADSARPYSGVYSALWKGNEGLGHARGVEAVWENAARADVIPGQRITASAQIALDDTSTSQNRGRVQLVFFDENDDEILRREGTLIRGDNENYRLSEVPVYGPNGAKSAGVAVWTTANESPGSGVRFGAVEWDAPQVVGINVDTTLCFTVTVRDSAGRTAQWSGCVSVQPISWSAGATFANRIDAAVWAEFGGQRQLFVAGTMVGGVTTIYKSTDDGSTANVVPSVPGTFAVQTGAFGGDGAGGGVLIFRQGFNGVVRTTDGVNFSYFTVPVSDAYRITLWTGAGFVGLGSSRYRLYSATGASGAWSYYDHGSVIDIRLAVLIPNPTPGLHGRVIAFAANNISYSDNGGASWTTISYTDPQPSQAWLGAYYEGGIVYAYKEVSSGVRRLYQSADDGITWSNETISWPNTGLTPSAGGGVVLGETLWLGFVESFDVATPEMKSSNTFTEPFSTEAIAGSFPLSGMRALTVGQNGNGNGNIAPGDAAACLILTTSGAPSQLVVGK